LKKIIFLHGLLGSRNNFEYLEQKLSGYDTSAIDLIGFGNERKPKLRYELHDFLSFLERRLGLADDNATQYVLVGHSLGALLAKELTIRYPERVIKAFLISYPFFEKEQALQGHGCFDRKYAEGAWWPRWLCQTEKYYQWLFYPLIFLFRYKHRKSYIDFFKHTYRSAYGAIRNTIFNDDRENLSAIANKIILINGDEDRSVDLEFAKRFDTYFVAGMGHRFFGHEGEVAEVIKASLAGA
jgi:pimeloyl-ACP methyl ester carboxylesterase